MLPLILARLLWRSRKNPKYRFNWFQRFGRVREVGNSYDIWIHAVSLGEANASVPLIQKLIQKYPDLRIFVTTMTPTGLERIKEIFGNHVGYSYAPYDYSFAISKFMSRVKPKILILIETEIWPNMIDFCKKADVPVVMLNMRLSSTSTKNYQRIAWLTKKTLLQITSFGVQSEKHCERLATLGVKRSSIHRTGSMKFEMKLAAGVHEIAEAVRQDWGQDRLVIIAGSTHEGEETLLATIFHELKRMHQELLLVIAPRHPERFDGVCRLLERNKFQLLRRTEQHGALPPTVDILVADTLGELSVLYAAADIAIVGGSFISGLGGHNILEPCSVGVPVIFGPFMPNFEEISALTVEANAGIQVQNAEGLRTILSKLLIDPNLRSSMGDYGVEMINKNSGATELSLRILEPILNNLRE